MDVDNDDVTYAMNGLPEGARFDEGTQTLTWPAQFQEVGEYVLNFSASDGQLTTERTLNIEVFWILIDSDGDGLDDDIEIEYGLDPHDRDTDGDTIDDATEFGDGEEAIDTDEDGLIDAEDEDSDGDTVLDIDEAGDADPDTPPIDTDEDGLGDWRDRDSDGDTIFDDTDNCRLISNVEPSRPR